MRQQDGSNTSSSAVIRVGGYAPPESVHSRAVDHFASVIEQNCNGEIEVEILYNVMDDGRPATDLFRLLQSGELTWCYYSTSYLGATVPALNALEIPFLFDTPSEAHAALDGPFGAALAEAVNAEEGYEVLGYWDNGMRHLTNAVRDIRSPSDCEGLTIRLQPNHIHEELARSWHMRPVPAELSDGIAMIKRGEVDAQENPLANTVAYGVDHQHITLSGHLYGARGLFADGRQLQAMGELGDAVRAAAGEAIAFQRTAAAAYERELRVRLEAEGRVVLDLSADQRQAFAAAAEPVVDGARAAAAPELMAMLS